MMQPIRFTMVAVQFSLFAALSTPLASQSLAHRADTVFRAYRLGNVPGCAIGVDQGGAVRLRAAYGRADLEHPVRNTASTIFEAGSVAEQFTAAAVLLLAARGKLSMDDEVQRWFPELPAYQAPITIRHLMLHTSGLRDWGAVAALEGWPRGSRAATQADALAIIARQRGLNHAPGERSSYTNTGYNLMAMLVERVSGMTLADFTRREFFVPLGMTQTSWRDDFTRVVPGRAQAYAKQGTTWVLDMPFENTHGNGGLLTTVGNLLTWTRALGAGRIGTPDVSGAMKTPGRFNNDSAMAYGGGLALGPIRGIAAVSHTGATGGYRSVLATFPDQQLSVAILCNAGDAVPANLAQALLERTLPFGPEPRSPEAPIGISPRVDRAQLAQYAGSWRSEEAASLIRITVADSVLMLHRRPGQLSPLRMMDTDRFGGPGGTAFRFVRDSNGVVAGLFVTISRAVDVPYQRILP